MKWFLLQQALKYENFEDIKEGYRRLTPGRDISGAVQDEKEAQLEKKDSRESNSTITNDPSSLAYNPADQLASSNINSVIEMVDPSQRPDNGVNVTTDSTNTDTLQSDCLIEEEDTNDLASFLIQRACKNSTLANYFYWYLLIECEDQEATIKQDSIVREMYLTVMKTFSQTLAKGNAEWQRRRDFLARQQKFIDKLVKLIKCVSRESGNRKKKGEKMQQLLSDKDVFKIDFTKFEAMPFPLDPEIQIVGIKPEEASLFKSALMPSKLTFVTAGSSGKFICFCCLCFFILLFCFFFPFQLMFFLNLGIAF